MTALNVDPIDVTHFLHPPDDYFPVCPICNRDIEHDRRVMIVRSFDRIALAHTNCTSNIEDYLKRKGA